MQRFLVFSYVLILLAGWSCTQEGDAVTVVATEEVIFVSGEKIRILGRLITNQPVSVTDHGFLISTSENFISPIVVSLGEKKGPGRFIGEITTLSIHQNYFVKAFVNVDGVELYGETIPVNTLSPVIDSFSPALSFAGEELVIVGRNFTADTRVFFGDQEATILDLDFESRLKVRIPAFIGKASVPLIVYSQNERLESTQPFEYYTGKYTLLMQFPEAERIYDNVYFQDQNGFYAGLGSIKSGYSLTSFRRFDPRTGIWTSIDFPGETRKGGFAAAGYIGGGADVAQGSFTYKRDFWKLNGDGFERLADIPTESFHSLAFEANGQLFYAGGGDDPRAIQKYDPTVNSWSTQSVSPIEFESNMTTFTYQNKAYFMDSVNVIWEYEPVSDSWSKFTEMPSSVGTAFGIAQVIGNKVYIGLFSRSTVLRELNMTTKTWKSKNPIPGLAASLNAGAFVFEDQLYLLRTPEKTVPGAPMEFYLFEPDGI